MNARFIMPVATILATGAVLVAAGALDRPRSAEAAAPAFCSLVASWDARGEGPYFLGRATGDTVPVTLPETPGDESHQHLSPARPHGQVVEVGEVRGALADSLERVFARRGARRAVLVPWGTRADCRRTYWYGSARFATPGPEGMYDPKLRPAEQWADGIPTFDVFHPWLVPYPQGEGLERGSGGEPRERWLTARQYFDFHRTLPVWRQGARLALTPEMRRWRAAHPKLARRFPASASFEYLSVDTAR
jgi:hypothetical protein